MFQCLSMIVDRLYPCFHVRQGIESSAHIFTRSKLVGWNQGWTPFQICTVKPLQVHPQWTCTVVGSCFVCRKWNPSGKNSCTKQSSMVIDKQTRKGRIIFVDLRPPPSTKEPFQTKDLGLTANPAILVLYDFIFYCLRRFCLFSCGTPFCGTRVGKSETEWNVGLLL